MADAPGNGTSHGRVRELQLAARQGGRRLGDVRPPLRLRGRRVAERGGTRRPRLGQRLDAVVLEPGVEEVGLRAGQHRLCRLDIGRERGGIDLEERGWSAVTSDPSVKRTFWMMPETCGRISAVRSAETRPGNSSVTTTRRGSTRITATRGGGSAGPSPPPGRSRPPCRRRAAARWRRGRWGSKGVAGLASLEVRSIGHVAAVRRHFHPPHPSSPCGARVCGCVETVAGRSTSAPADGIHRRQGEPPP